MELRDRLRVQQVAGVARLVGFSGMPSAVPEEEMKMLRASLARGVRVEPHPFLTVGRRVRVKSGPMAGLHGILKHKKNQARLVVSVELIQRAMAVEVEEADVEPLQWGLGCADACCFGKGNGVMASLETTPLLDVKPEAISTPPDKAKGEGWKPSAVVGDIATLGAGTAVAAVLNTLLVFLIPRLMNVEEYGYWRLFLLYAGFVGFLHLGFADGALLRWAGRGLQEFRPEIGPAVSYLFWQQAVVAAIVCAIAALVLPGPFRFVVFAVGIYAPLYNVTAILQFSLQGARIFRPVAVSAIAAPALFCVLALLWASGRPSSSREFITLFLLAWFMPLTYLLARTRPWVGARGEVSSWTLAKDCVLSGWPIMATNAGVMLIVSADRLAVSWATTIQSFAQYSLAASAIAVPIMMIQASSKVFFSHLAGVKPGNRIRIYGTSSRVLLVAWAILLPYYFALDVFIRHLLTRYVPSLQYARILLLGIPFMAVIQIVQMSYAYLNGIQKQFLVRTVTVLALTLGVTSFAAFHAGSLRFVACVQVAVLGAWWLQNEVALRESTGQGAQDWARFGGVFLLAGVSYWLTSGLGLNVGACALLYWLSAVIILGLFCRAELKVIFSELDGGGVLVREEWVHPNAYEDDRDSSCKVCGERQASEIYEAREMMFGLRTQFHYAQCAACSSLWLTDPPEDYRVYYPRDYYSFLQATGGVRQRLKDILRAKRDATYFGRGGYFGRWLARRYQDGVLPPVSKLQIGLDSRVLDVGCGTGKLLHRMAALGFRNLVGVDPLLPNEVGRGNGVRIRACRLEDVGEEKFDVVMFHHSLEHVANPLRALQAAARLLVRDGKCLVRLPVVGYAWERYGANWVELDPPRHLWVPTEKAMEILAESAGLRVERVEHDSTDFQFWGSELCVRGVPLRGIDGSNLGAYFCREEVEEFKRNADELNRQHQGDAAVFFLAR
jgi:SAM-dependent methyltransferase/O-antigen/teichoic acid export membrane protein